MYYFYFRVTYELTLVYRMATVENRKMGQGEKEKEEKVKELGTKGAKRRNRVLLFVPGYVFYLLILIYLFFIYNYFTAMTTTSPNAMQAPHHHHHHHYQWQQQRQ